MIVLICACLITVFSKIGENGGIVTYGNRLIFQGVAAFIIFLCLQFLFCRHLTSTLLPFFLTLTMPLKCYNSYNEFITFVPLAIPFILALLIRIFVLYPAPFHKTSVYRSYVPATIAVTLGGLGTLTFSDYIAVSFYIAGLGIGILILCYILGTQYQNEPNYNMADEVERAMCFLAIFSIFMVAHFYYITMAHHAETMPWKQVFQEKFRLLYFQWRNNISTTLMIAMPFLFSRAHKHLFYLPIGLLSFVTLIFSNSRGGILFGSLEFIACFILYIVKERRRVMRIVMYLFCAVVAFGAFQFKHHLPKIKEALWRITNLFDKEAMMQESRFRLIGRAWQDFLRNPLFGSGLGYQGNVDIYNPAKGSLYFYHSAPLQIIGSMGILGIFAYGYQLWMQSKLLWRVHTKFSATVALSIASLWGMSMVNPGVFSPVPFAVTIPILLVVSEKSAPQRTFL